MIQSFREMTIIGRVGVLVGIVASVSGIALSVILCLFNPYVGGIAKETIPVALFGLGLPALMVGVASLYGMFWLSCVAFIYSLPLSLYLAGTPGLFRFFLPVSIGYLILAITLRVDQKLRNVRH
ncbi:hypothetical protein [Desulfitobacterium sp. LBE]|uniref:hypothetical protein n=1 Tax=Desulfitobacterium sp. LBE TaxID=884086 RepID=UPI00155A7116|nr:hypothetical protein [Desulfitobacterium sp. LBE]